MILGYHAPHEQYPPGELLAHLRAAERAGFRHAMCSDHLAPFTPEQGHSGFAWTWLGAALQATGMTLGTVSAPGGRYHPAVLAQAAATCAAMFPGRFWVALGSGERLNEHVTGAPWPAKAGRDGRLEACAGAMRRLLRGEEVSLDDPVRIDRARLWSLPSTPPPLYGAALTPATAAKVARWADGLATVSRPAGGLRAVVEAYRGAGGRGPVLVQAQLSWAADGREALAAAHREWRMCALGPGPLEDLDTPHDIQRAAAGVTPEQVRDAVAVASDLSGLLDEVRAWRRLGVAAAYLHNVGRDQRGFLAEAARVLLPESEEVARAPSAA